MARTKTLKQVADTLRAHDVWVRRVFGSPTLASIIYNSDFLPIAEEIYLRPGARLLMPLEDVRLRGSKGREYVEADFRLVIKYLGEKYKKASWSEMPDQLTTFRFTTEQLKNGLLYTQGKNIIELHRKRGRGYELDTRFEAADANQKSTWILDEYTDTTYRNMDCICL